MEFNRHYSTQNRSDPSGFGSNTIGDVQSVVAGSITPFSGILSMSIFPFSVGSARPGKGPDGLASSLVRFGLGVPSPSARPVGRFKFLRKALKVL